jgi:hypothetical protein
LIRAHAPLAVARLGLVELVPMPVRVPLAKYILGAALLAALAEVVAEDIGHLRPGWGNSRGSLSRRRRRRGAHFVVAADVHLVVRREGAGQQR